MFRSKAPRFALGLLGLSLGLVSQPLSSFAHVNPPAVNSSNQPNPQLLARNCDGWWRKVFVEGCQEADARDGADPTLPYAINPVNTSVRQGQRPVIHWNSVRSSTPYQLQVLGPGIPRMEPLLIEGDRWQYPAALPLEPETRYVVQVQKPGVRCGEECEADFVVLSDAEMAAFQADWDRLSEEERRNPLVVADVFQKHELYADAIQRLEQAIATGEPTQEHHHFLGELYAVVGLYQRALEQYEVARGFLVGQDDREVRAWLNVEIGQAHWQLGELREALGAFEAAYEDADVLGEQEAADLWERIEMVRDRI